MPIHLLIDNLHVRTGTQEILKGIFLRINAGQIHAIMGPNGSGKSTLAKVIMGHPGYTVTKGKVLLNKENILKLEPDLRARRGVFMAFQYPVEVPGVTMFSYLRAIYAHRAGKVKKKAIQKHPGAVKRRREGDGTGVSVAEFEAILSPIVKKLRIGENFLERSLNEGFSGGEKKKAEVLQMAVLKPSVIILDETDSGLDIDALRIVADGVREFRPKDSAVLIITHYQRILKYVKPDFVHVMKEGRIVESGGYELAKRLEKRGYSALRVQSSI